MVRGLASGEDGKVRCAWATVAPDYVAYHDGEWGFPVDDDRRLFEKLCLEGFQSGLSWLTILRKREGFRRAFAGFDHRKVARFDEAKVERLLADAAIVRHRGKIEATIRNAVALRGILDEFDSLAAFVWRFEPEASTRPRRLTWATLRKLTTTPESEALSKELRSRGFGFVGPTTVYAFMQAMGLVNDHVEGCCIRPRAEEARSRFRRPTTDVGPKRGSRSMSPRTV